MCVYICPDKNYITFCIWNKNTCFYFKNFNPQIDYVVHKYYLHNLSE